MKTSDFDFSLPRELIAQNALRERAAARLMVVDRRAQTIAHHQVFDLPVLLRPTDCVVLNNSKVFPARLFGKKMETGGEVEVLLLQEYVTDAFSVTWEVMLKTKHPRVGIAMVFSENVHAKIIGKNDTAAHETWVIEFLLNAHEFRAFVERNGATPIPPYITSHESEQTLRAQYQTVYAQKEGSVAAPTAGLHFTPELLEQLRSRGMQVAYVTLHVGLGTFAPVKTERLENHRMHEERIEVSPDAAQTVNAAKTAGHRIVAVGTTSVRTLESSWNQHDGKLHAGEHATNIFITPGYQFQCLDAMLTNFHLPKSTLLMLVCAFGGYALMMRAYHEAIAQKYRFFSFGDAMLIL